MIAAALASGCAVHAPPTVGSHANSDAASEGLLRDEAGFIEVAPQQSAAQYRARMFYIFERADSDPETKPLAVLFNGGPGFPTSAGLSVYGTARYTLDPTAPPGSPAIINPARWTTFANLLYIDERQTGFSYGLGMDTVPGGGGCTYSPVNDAADFVSVVDQFIQLHPALQNAPLLLAGESYGGTRATLMLDHILHGQVTSFAGAPIRRFGRVVLMQPFILGPLQIQWMTALAQGDPYLANVSPQQDPLDVREPSGYTDGLIAAALGAIASSRDAPHLLAVDPSVLPNLTPADRAGAFRMPPAGLPAEISGAVDRANAYFTGLLGALRTSDAYLELITPACQVAAPADASTEFVSDLMAGVKVFITNARYDQVYAPAIPVALSKMPGVASVHVSNTSSPGEPRPGSFTVVFAFGSGAMQAAEVRFPPYVDSGHMVAVTEAQHLHDDVAAWLAGTL